MTRTPDVIDGATITSTWGNEIRDRSVQVFATTADRDTWLAPNGSFAVVTANNALYQRVGGAWVFPQLYQAGSGSYQTGSDGTVMISHTLGAIPTSVNGIAGGSPGGFAYVVLTGRTATTITFKCFSTAGNAEASQTCAIHWQVFR